MIDVFGDKIEVKVEEKEVKQKKVSLFDFISDISYNKRYLLDDNAIDHYTPFMVNRGLSQHIDTILLAEEANRMSLTNKQMHHDFLFYTVSAKRRYGKWAKHTDDETIKLIQEKYKINRNRAEEYYKLMNNDDIINLKESYNKGGRV